MPAKDEPVKTAIAEVIGSKKRGRKKIIPKIKAKHSFSASRIRRVYVKYGFALLKKPRKRIRSHPRNPIERTLLPNQEWAMDFMSDALVNGRRIRSLNIIDHYNLECKAVQINYSLPAIRVIEILEQVISVHGKPARIRTDNGPEFTSKQFQLWMQNNDIAWSKIQKGKPQQNAIVERFNRTFREDVFDANLLFSIEHANELADEFKQEYNYERPHESLKDKTPIEYAA